MTDSGEEPPKIAPEVVLARAAGTKEAVALFGLLLLPGFALRALIFARFDPTVSTALVQFTQPLNFFLNFLLDTTPIFLYVGGLTVLFWCGGRRQRGASGHYYLAILTFFLALMLTVPIIMISPFPEVPSYIFMLGFLPASFSAGAVLAKFKGKSDHELLHAATIQEEREAHLSALQTRIDLRIYKVGAVVAVTTYALFGRMWLTPEVLTIRDAPRTGYVLQEQDLDMVVYDPSLHAVLRVPKSEISHRQFCNTQDVTVAQYLLGSPQGRPPC
ncbi:MAG: hypothetical protein ACRDSM_05295 [Pseudonocardiaceae bacterium]